VTFEEALRQGLKVVDAAAFSLCMDNGCPWSCSAWRATATSPVPCEGERIGTLVTAG
jgi:uridylate kinase